MEEKDVSKDEERTNVLILTGHCRIAGEIALLPGARLTDYVADSKTFFAVTNAEVTDHAGRWILSATFLNVNRDHVEIIAPAELTTRD